MTIGEQLAAMKAEHAQGVMQGLATRRFWRTVTAMVRRLSVHEVGLSDREDLVQRSVLAACKMIHEFEYRGPEAFSGWLRAIVRYEALALRRKGATHGRLVRRLEQEPARVAGRSPSSLVLAGQRWRAIETAMKLLGPRQRESLEFADTHELAQAKGIVKVTARRRRRRAEKRLQILVEPDSK